MVSESSSHHSDNSHHSDSSHHSESPPAHPSVKRGRGRPRKPPPSRSPSPKPKAKRGRPTREMVKQRLEAGKRRNPARGNAALGGQRASPIVVDEDNDAEGDGSQPDTTPTRPQVPRKRKVDGRQVRRPRQGPGQRPLYAYPSRPAIDAASFEADLAAGAGRDPNTAASWSEADEADQVLALKSDVWMNLWRVSLHHFRRSPDDLFTWGLRFSDGRVGTLRSLVQLMVHPIWGRSLDLMRYFIQKAVFLRVENHMIPMGPLSPALLSTLVGDRDVEEEWEKGAIASMAVRYWSHAGPERDGTENVNALAKEMERRMRGQRRPADGLRDDRLFNLQIEDIDLLWECLNSMARDAFFPASVEEYYSGFTQAVVGRWGQLPPESDDQLRSWMRMSELGRRGARLRGEPDFPAADLEAHWNKVPYWLGDGCDNRFEETMIEQGGSTPDVRDQDVRDETWGEGSQYPVGPMSEAEWETRVRWLATREENWF
ncbi:hypothetical protein DL769_000632 [Monosporascus sp. CRB-8-3]|nr:hypothetical protein DL769_000632 [Monosporascus sp. CRB-8-3]